MSAYEQSGKSPPVGLLDRELLALDQILLNSASRYGTPQYLYMADVAKVRLRLLQSMLPRGATVYYSVKSNPCLGVVQVFRGQGVGMEVASAGELDLALEAGTRPEDILFVGPWKPDHALESALKQGVGIIVVESSEEASRLDMLARSLGVVARVALRINPGRGDGLIAMGGPTPFGMTILDAQEIIARLDRFKGLEIIGIHGYLGTGILDCQAVARNTRMLLEAAVQLQKTCTNGWWRCRFVDLGGGFGIPYHEGETELDGDVLRRVLSDTLDEFRVALPDLASYAFEAGRFLVGPAGIFLTRVRDVKEAYGKRFLVLDGGINVFGLDSRHVGARPLPLRLICGEGPVQPVTLCGPLCTPLDCLAKNVLLPAAGVGDLLAFYHAGAYGLTASPGLFLSHGFCSEVLAVGDELVHQPAKICS